MYLSISIFKIFRGSMPPDPLEKRGLRPRVIAWRSHHLSRSHLRLVTAPGPHSNPGSATDAPQFLRPRLHEDDVKTIGTKSYLSGKKSFRIGLLYRACLHEDDPYPQTFEDDTKTIEKVETFEDDTETIGHRLRVNTISG